MARFSTLMIFLFPTVTFAAAPPQVGPEIASVTMPSAPFLTSSKTSWGGGAESDSQSAPAKPPSGLNSLVVKFARYDTLFMDLIDNASRHNTDGYQVKYKFYF